MEVGAEGRLIPRIRCVNSGHKALCPLLALCLVLGRNEELVERVRVGCPKRMLLASFVQVFHSLLGYGSGAGSMRTLWPG